MHRGMDLVKENSPEELQKAIRCFDEAIALRSALPLAENPFFRYGLSAGWINRADALARLEGDDSLAEAINSYDEALLLLESLPLEENILYPRRLAIAWINRGMALQKQPAPGSAWEAAECFREAIEVLEHPSAITVAGNKLLLAGAWCNLAGALMASGKESVEDIQLAAVKALQLASTSEKADIISAEIGMKARHILCRLVTKNILDKKPVSEILIAETTDAVEDALALARHWKSQGDAQFVKLAREIFRFGCRIYENCQPHFLAEFLMEHLALETFPETMLCDEETHNNVQAVIWGRLDKLQPKGFGFISTSHLEPLLSDIQELRKVEDRLKQLRPMQRS